MVPDGQKFYEKKQILERGARSAALGNEALANLLAQALEKVPEHVVDAVLRHCLFLMPKGEEEGMFLPNRVIKNRHVFGLPEVLLHLPKNQQMEAVLKQIAHYVLHHWSPLERDDVDFERQDQEAFKLVEEWASREFGPASGSNEGSE